MYEHNLRSVELAQHECHKWIRETQDYNLEQWWWKVGVTMKKRFELSAKTWTQEEEEKEADNIPLTRPEAAN